MRQLSTHLIDCYLRYSLPSSLPGPIGGCSTEYAPGSGVFIPQQGRFVQTLCHPKFAFTFND
jgi:hypothetical protein